MIMQIKSFPLKENLFCKMKDAFSFYTVQLSVNVLHLFFTKIICYYFTGLHCKQLVK